MWGRDAEEPKEEEALRTLELFMDRDGWNTIAERKPVSEEQLPRAIAYALESKSPLFIEVPSPPSSVN